MASANQTKPSLSKIDRYITLLNEVVPSEFPADTVGNVTSTHFKHFVLGLKVKQFRHLKNVDVSFDHPVTVISGSNRSGKTSMLLLIACSHEEFYKYDSTKPDTHLKKHKWVDVMSFTKHETANADYEYSLVWRRAQDTKTGIAKRLHTSQGWTGLGKSSNSSSRSNKRITERQVRLIDLERLLPARSFSGSLLRKVQTQDVKERMSTLIEDAFSYILDLESVEIFKIGSHVNKFAFLINIPNQSYSTYNSASGEDSLINILIDIIETDVNSLILIDEVEAGFHPTIQRRLLEIIQMYSWCHKKQFIITTHSPTVIASLTPDSRRFIDIDTDGKFKVIKKISTPVAFSKMDIKSHPLITLYCEDILAEFIIKMMLISINGEYPKFSRYIHIIKSGPYTSVATDFKRHLRNFKQMPINKTGCCCVFDGDCYDKKEYQELVQAKIDSKPLFDNLQVEINKEAVFVFILQPNKTPELSLVESYLTEKPNRDLSISLKRTNNHDFFEKMVELSLAPDRNAARDMCWHSFTKSQEYIKMYGDFKEFIVGAIIYYSNLVEE